MDVGISHSNYQSTYVEFRLGGAFAIKEKFRVSILITYSNQIISPSLFPQVRLNAAYQVHNNSGVYNTSLITIGLNTPTLEDVFMRNIVQYNIATSFEFNVGYVGAIRLNKRWGLFPNVEYYYQSANTRAIFVGATTPAQNLTHQGIRAKLTMGYDLNAKNFVQLTAGGNFGSYWQVAGTESTIDFGTLTNSAFLYNFRFQHGFTRTSQVFIEFQQRFNRFNDAPKILRNQNTAALRMGFLYFLE